MLSHKLFFSCSNILLKQRSIKEVVYETCKICMRIQMKLSNSQSYWSIAGKSEPLESPPRLALICFKTFDLNLIYPDLLCGL